MGSIIKYEFPDNITDIEIGYIVGIIDGEGYIGFDRAYKNSKTGKEYHRFRISIGMQCENIIQFIYNKLKTGHIYKRVTSGFSDIPLFVWACQANEPTYKILKRIEPLLIEKREKAIEAIKFYEEVCHS